MTAGGWHPAKDGPPARSGRYLCSFTGCRDEDAVDMLFFDADTGAWTGPWWMDRTLTAWQPPPPWDGGVTEDPAVMTKAEERKSDKREAARAARKPRMPKQGHPFCICCTFYEEMSDGGYCMNPGEPGYHKKTRPGTDPACSIYREQAGV